MHLCAAELTVSTPILEHTPTLRNPCNFQRLQQINDAIRVHPENNWSGAWITSVGPIHCCSSCSNSSAAFKDITNWEELVNLSWSISVSSHLKVLFHWEWFIQPRTMPKKHKPQLFPIAQAAKAQSISLCDFSFPGKKKKKKKEAHLFPSKPSDSQRGWAALTPP